MYRLNQIKLNICHDDYDLKKKIAKLVKLSVDDIDWSTFIILHKSIDARDKDNILFVYNVAFDTKLDLRLEKYEPVIFNPIIKEKQNVNIRPVVVGFGPAGLFASYILALNGFKPIILERGKALDDRIKDVDKFFKTMALDCESNVCFGEGGAGAFSDGKLNTNNKDKTGIYRFVLETFVKFGAQKNILYDNMPHIGTDKLVDVIKNMRNEIIRLGGEIFYNTKFCFKDGKPSINITNDTPVILAIGNSSRDTFRELIKNGFDLKAKPIAAGYRIAHKHSFINEAQYGNSINHIKQKNISDKLLNIDNLLGPATYKLTYDVGNGHSVYSFCMCPGGYIINSSNCEGMLSINGMSYNDRNGKYANSAIVETIGVSDVANVVFENDMKMTHAEDKRDVSECSPLQMIEFQEQVEKMAFELEKGFIPYVTGNGDDICQEDVFKGRAKYSKKLMSVYETLGLKININKDIEMAFKHFNKIIPGFYGNEYVIAGVETRTSSPVKLDRDENYMCNIRNFYPCGEGLGHGGGIMSCAVDGINVAMAVAKKLYSG